MMIPDKRYEALQNIVLGKFRKICEDYPEIQESGGTLLLGKSYANPDSKILMLGINPGKVKEKYKRSEIDLNPQEQNVLLSDPSNGEIKYWKNSKILFNAKPSLRKRMETATFSFCCPFRTNNWNDLDKDLRAYLTNQSTDILKQILLDCSPSCVIVSGIASLKLFRFMAIQKPYPKSVIPIEKFNHSDIYQWAKYTAIWNDKEIIIIQLPHLSYANGVDRLRECGRWLDQQLDAIQY